MTVTAIVVAGAGARGAYEAGVLSVLVPRLIAHADPDDRIVMIGTSAGAINTAVLSAYTDPGEATARLLDLWRTVHVADIFTRLRTASVRDVGAYVRQIIGGGRDLHSLLDTSPLQRTMTAKLSFEQLQANLRGGRSWVHTAGIVTTAIATRRTVVFLQGDGDQTVPPRDDERGIGYVRTDLDVRHVLASTAIPVAFLPVQLGERDGGGWYVDGGVRLNVPIKPALTLGADRVVVVGTAPDPDGPATGPAPAPAPAPAAGPDVFDIAGTVAGCLLDDRMAEDVRALRRTNRLIAATGTSDRPVTEVRNGDRTYRVVPLLVIGPADRGLIGRLAGEVYQDRYRRWHLLSDLGVLGRLIGGSPASRGELLSYLLFDADFHDALIELGRARAAEVLGPGDGPVVWPEP